jgi:hypothetical protein
MSCQRKCRDKGCPNIIEDGDHREADGEGPYTTRGFADQYGVTLFVVHVMRVLAIVRI